MLPALIERLEKAEEGSRLLDAEIMFDLFAEPVGTHPDDGGPTGYLYPLDNASWTFGIRFPGKDREWFTSIRKHHGETIVIERDGALVLMNSLRIPPVTTSITDALALMPAGYYWSIDSRGHCVVMENGDVYGECLSHKIPAIALCKTALKARAEAKARAAATVAA